MKECGSHSSKIGLEPCHAIPPCCKIDGNDEEGYGTMVTCHNCSLIEVSLQQNLHNVGKTDKKKRQVMWDWRMVATSATILEKKKKIEKTVAKKSSYMS